MTSTRTCHDKHHELQTQLSHCVFVFCFNMVKHQSLIYKAHVQMPWPRVVVAAHKSPLNTHRSNSVYTQSKCITNVLHRSHNGNRLDSFRLANASSYSARFLLLAALALASPPALAFAAALAFGPHPGGHWASA